MDITCIPTTCCGEIFYVHNVEIAHVTLTKTTVSKSTSAAHSINDRMNEFTTRQENGTNTYRGQPNQLLVFSASRLAFSKNISLKEIYLVDC